MTEKEIINFCKDLGCCDLCCLRYVGHRNPANYENPRQFIDNLKDISDTSTSQAPTDKSEINSDSVKDDKDAPTDDKTKNEIQETMDTTESEAVVERSFEKEETAGPPTDIVNTETSQKSDKLTNNELNNKDIHNEQNYCKKIQNGDEDVSNEPPAKRMKVDGVCVSCIGVLQEDTWPQAYQMVKEVLEKKRYECEMFACALSAPLATAFRERAITLRLADTFKNYDDKNLTPLKEAWKWSFVQRLSSQLDKKLDSGSVSPLLITITVDYPDDLQEVEVLKTLAPSLFESRSRQRRRFAVEFTRRSVEQALEGATLARLSRLAGWAKVPAPRSRAHTVAVVCEHTPLYLGGRYVKLSRELPQTPWLVGGQRMMESSVQEIIFQPIADAYQMSGAEAEQQLKFMSAGREDVDVRCLGEGRPFAIEITDPRRHLTPLELQKVCKEISSTNQVVVKSLVYVTRDDLTQLKRGEESKCKTYEALCIKLTHSEGDARENGHTDDQSNDTNKMVGVPVTDQDIARINSYRNTDADDVARVTLQQRTPVRVLHRRPLLVRSRRILALEARKVPEHPALFVVRVRTDAGTYVKEWVHGELRRTAPSLAHALRARTDILALDVAAVELDWPAALH